MQVLNRQDARVEEDIATALGLLTHALVMIAKYFEIPTNLVLVPCCSRSYVRQLGSDNIVPLYYKGLDRHKFEQGLQNLTDVLRNSTDFALADLSIHPKPITVFAGVITIVFWGVGREWGVGMAGGGPYDLRDYYYYY